MWMLAPGLVLTVLSSTVSASARYNYCRQDDCLKEVQHAPWNQLGCSSFFKKTVTATPVTRVHWTTTTVHPRNTVTDGVTVDKTVSSTTTLSYTDVDTITDTVSATASDATATTSVPTTVTVTTVVYSSTEIDVTTPTVVLKRGYSTLAERYYPLSNPPCPTAAAGPSKVPDYVQCCHNTAAYSSACSCVGAPHQTTTLPPCTTTVTSTVTVTKGRTAHASVTVTSTITAEATASTTTTRSTTTTITTTTTPTVTTTVPNGLTVTDITTSTTDAVTTTTLVLPTVTVCTFPQQFKLEAIASNEPVTLQELKLSSDAQPNQVLNVALATDGDIARFYLETTSGKVNWLGLYQSNPAEYAMLNSQSNVINVNQPGSLPGPNLVCSISTNPTTNCKYPFSCTSVNGAPLNFFYCNSSGARAEGLYANIGDTDPSCSSATMYALNFPL